MQPVTGIFWPQLRSEHRTGPASDLRPRSRSPESCTDGPRAPDMHGLFPFTTMAKAHHVSEPATIPSSMVVRSGGGCLARGCDGFCARLGGTAGYRPDGQGNVCGRKGPLGCVPVVGSVREPYRPIGLSRAVLPVVEVAVPSVGSRWSAQPCIARGLPRRRCPSYSTSTSLSQFMMMSR